jgi:hypothetical protein
MPVLPQKPKEERVKETIALLRQLQDIGILETDPGYLEIKERLTTWVKTGDSATFEVDFVRTNRRAEVVLPRRADRAASINLKVRRGA